MNQTQSIDDLLPKMRLEMSRTDLPSVSCRGEIGQSTPAAMRVVEKYHNEDNFLALFNPSKQVAYTRDLKRAFRGDAPSLSLIAKSFGTSARDNWLDIQLTELAVFSGCKDRLTSQQINSLIDIIAEEYHYLKVTELMDFFRRFKLGEYGKFYGSVDPLVITTALKEFLQQRRQILYALDQEDRERGKREDASRIRFKRDYEAACKMRKFYSYNFRSTDFTLEDFKEIYWLFKLGYERSDHGYDEG